MATNVTVTYYAHKEVGYQWVVRAETKLFADSESTVTTTICFPTEAEANNYVILTSLTNSW